MNHHGGEYSGKVSRKNLKETDFRRSTAAGGATTLGAGAARGGRLAAGDGGRSRSNVA